MHNLPGVGRDLKKEMTWPRSQSFTSNELSLKKTQSLFWMSGLETTEKLGVEK